MSRTQRIGIMFVVAGVAAALMIPPLLRGAAPVGGTGGASAADGGRSFAALKKDLTETDAALKAILPTPMLLSDADFRKESGPKAIPLTKKMASILAEVEKADPDEAISYHRSGLIFLMYAAALGDADAMKQLDDAGKSKESYAIAARSDAMIGRWISASTDSAEQGKILDEMAAIAKDNATSTDVEKALNYMANIGGANNDLTKKVIEVMRTNMKTDNVKDLLAQLDANQVQVALVGKPLAIEGRTSTGTRFDVAAYKGKVVMIDFWATWCGPCVEELPNVKKAYKEYHDKGFEIVGLSCDSGDGELNDFVKSNGMPWVQLREKSQTEEERWHPLAKKYGVEGIPTMFLLDKQGVLRYVDARDGLEGKIAKLIAEPVKAAN